MLIDQIFPEVVAEKDTLRNRLLVEAATRDITVEQADTLVSSIPEPLINADAFLDKMTKLWRYEFGLPYDIADKYVFGTDMWLPVDNLFSAILSVQARLPADKIATYLNRLTDPGVHQITLVEMIPADKISIDIPMEFEVAGLGEGNRTVDWVIGPHCDRTVLLDVKRRVADFINQAEHMNSNGAESQPNHDPELLFRSVEEKFVSTDPNVRLQGAWLFTNIKQDEELLLDEFAALDESKVHFTVLGDWKPDAHVLVRREQDLQYLLELFHVEPSTRFTFKNTNAE